MKYLNQFYNDLIKALHDCWDFAQKPTPWCTLEYQRTDTVLVPKAAPRNPLEPVSQVLRMLSSPAFPSCKAKYEKELCWLQHVLMLWAPSHTACDSVPLMLGKETGAFRSPLCSSLGPGELPTSFSLPQFTYPIAYFVQLSSSFSPFPTGKAFKVLPGPKMKSSRKSSHTHLREIT